MSHARRQAAAFALFVALAWLAGCGPNSRGDGDGGASGDATAGADAMPCREGAIRCAALTVETCEGGVFVPGETCELGCAADVGCTICTPGTGTCDGDTSHACNADGTAYEDVFCDPVMGLSCGASGLCEGACAPATLGPSYLGCEYHPTVTGNAVSSDFEFAVAVANASDEVATITLDRGALVEPRVFEVAPGGVRVERLPWVDALKLCNRVAPPIDACWNPLAVAARANGGAYRLRSTQPVTVYQFNALDYTLGKKHNSYSNDASLLLPRTTWGREIRAASWPTYVGRPSLVTITAAQDGTQVTVTAPYSTPAQGGAPAVDGLSPTTFTMNAGDVVELGTGFDNADLTGTLVEASHPVQVIGGNYCALVPALSVCCCDHLEESMFPVEALSNRYVVVPPATPARPMGIEQVVRLIAVRDGTSLTYEPAVALAPAQLGAAGDVRDLPIVDDAIVITASDKVLVAQLMQGSAAGDGVYGDPSLVLAIPVDQFRGEYLFHAPTNYLVNYVDIVAPVGTQVTLDGAPVTGWTPIGTSQLAVARVGGLDTGPGKDGNHHITGSAPFGITVYGYGDDTSYWYPGGLDLKPITID